MKKQTGFTKQSVEILTESRDEVTNLFEKAVTSMTASVKQSDKTTKASTAKPATKKPAKKAA